MFSVGFVTWYHSATIERRQRFPDGTRDGFHHIVKLRLTPEYSGYRFRQEEEARYGFIEKEETFRPEQIEVSTLVHRDDCVRTKVLANFIQNMTKDASTRLLMMNVRGQSVSDPLTRLAFSRKIEFCTRRAFSLPPEDFETRDEIVEVEELNDSEDEEYKRLKRKKDEARRNSPEYLAQQLLKELISQDDFERYCTHGYFYLLSPRGDFKYKIPKYGNVGVISGGKVLNSL